MGGPHATYYPEAVRTPGLDVVCQGEGEDATVELCNALARGDDHRGIRDLWVKDEGTIYKNPARELRRDLDGIPHPPRELLYAYDDSLRQRPLKSFTTNRGCPFPCSYCFNPSLVDHYGSSWKKVRVRSPEDVVDELVSVKRQGPLHVIGFRESIFVYSADWLRAFGELYRREVKLPYYCHLRADMMTEEMVELLAWSGCHTVNVGIETANETLANGVLKRQIRMDRLTAGIRMLKRAGIVVFADNILGIPGGTLQDDLATLELNIDLDVDYAASTLCTPYPGTGIAKYAVENGYFSGDFDLIDDSYYTESVLSFSSASEKRQIENLHKVFAVVAAIPRLLPLAKRLIELPPNDFFYAMFRSWYLICHMTDVMPRRLKWKDLAESFLGIFGIYRGRDDNWHPAPPPDPLPVVNAAEAVAACASTGGAVVTLRRKRQAETREEAADVR
jgi:anaerobic magnesium-protoporphyrin IX monomethyl ester cyclase